VFAFRVRDLSPSGMLMETEETLTRGDKIACFLLLPGPTRTEVAGEIVRTPRKRLVDVLCNQYLFHRRPTPPGKYNFKGRNLLAPIWSAPR
jgi:hypothetical protein